MTSTSPPRVLATTVGAALVLEAVVGFAVVALAPADVHQAPIVSLLHFDAGHSAFRLAVGLAGLAMARRLATARIFGLAVLLGYGSALFYAPDLSFFTYNLVDDAVHAVLALLGLLIALVRVRPPTPDRMPL